jgi:MFS transporter, CP family, cyanate transporter
VRLPAIRKAGTIHESNGSHAGASFDFALLLWLAGIALRLTILAVPPVIPLIHDELNLSATEIGILTEMSSTLFAFAAMPGSLLIARLGIRTALVVDHAFTAIDGALRGRAAECELAFMP